MASYSLTQPPSPRSLEYLYSHNPVHRIQRDRLKGKNLFPITGACLCKRPCSIPTLKWTRLSLMSAQEKSFSSPARFLTVWDSWFGDDLRVFPKDSLAALPQNLGWCCVCQVACLNPQLGKQEWCQGAQNHQAGLKIIRLKL